MPTARKPAREDPRVARTRTLIEEAFLAVMEEKGFEDLTVGDVADRAGINRVTFYSHFADTHALLAHTVRKAFAAEVEQAGLAGRRLDTSAVRELFTLSCTYVAGLRTHCRPPHLHLDWILEQEITAYCAQLFRTWAPSTQSPKDATKITFVATAASAAMYGLVSSWSHMKKPASATAFVASTLPIVTGILKVE